MTKAYEERKEKAREEAINWQNDFCNHSYSWNELAEYQAYFDDLARKYGLIREFRENGII